jgi:hypothetical protein
MKTITGSYPVARLVGRAAFVALVAGVTASADAQVATTKQGILVNGQWSAWVKQTDVLQSAMTTGAMGAQVTIHATSLGTPLLTLMESALTGRPLATKLQLASYTYQLAPVSALNVGTKIQEIDLPGGDASSTAIPVFTVKFAQGLAEQGKPAILAPPMDQPPTQPLRLNHFRLNFGDLDANLTRTVSPMTITPGAKVSDLVITTSPPSTSPSYQVWAKGLQAWFQSRTPRGGTLAYLSNDMMTTLFAVNFTGVVVKSIDTPTGAPATVTLGLTGVSFKFGGSGF